MNKFATVAVLAFAAFAVAQASPVDQFPDEAETQLALRTTDDVETQEVKNRNLEVFADFCVQSRDYVFADINNKAGSGASQSFSWIFSMSEEIAKEAIKVNQDATVRLSNQLANPDAAVEGDDMIADAQRDISGQSQPRAFLTAVQGSLVATAKAIVNKATAKFESVKQLADPRYAIDFLASACGQSEHYEHKMREQFDSYMSELPASAQEQYKKVTFDSVPCVTSRRISRVNGVCRFVNVAFDPIKKAIGY